MIKNAVAIAVINSRDSLVFGYGRKESVDVSGSSGVWRGQRRRRPSLGVLQARIGAVGQQQSHHVTLVFPGDVRESGGKKNKQKRLKQIENAFN